MTATSAIDVITSAVTDAGAVILPGIGVVMGVVAVLIGLFFVIRLVRKWIGGARG
jgi:hypothetical protein